MQVTTTAARPEDATPVNNYYKHRQPTNLEYYAKNLALGILGEGMYRKLGLTGTLNFRRLEELTGLNKILPSAQAEEVSSLVDPAANVSSDLTACNTELKQCQDTASNTATLASADLTTCKDELAACTAKQCPPCPEAAKETAKTCCLWEKLSLSNLSNFSFTDTGHAIINWTCENKEWLLLTGGIALTSAAVNHLTSKQIKNAYARNVISLAVGTVAVWAASNYGLSYQVDFNAVSDIGLRLLVTAMGSKVVVPGAQWVLELGQKSLNLFKFDMAHPVKTSKIKLA